MTSLFLRAYPLNRALTRIAARAFAPRLEIIGRAQVPWRGPVIVCCNHISDADPPFVAAALSRPLWFMAKRELFDVPILGSVMRYYQSFPIDPTAPDRAALRFTEGLLKAGSAVVIFPEGRIRPHATAGAEAVAPAPPVPDPTPLLGPVLPGAVAIALRSKAPVVPVGLWGTQRIVPYGSVIPRPTLGRVRLVFGSPLKLDDLDGLSRREAREAATERLERALHQVVERARQGG